MNDNQQSAPDTHGTPEPIRVRRGPWGRFSPSTIIFLLVLALVVIVQWPMLKGLFYRASSTAPDDHIPWRTDFQSALDESGKTGKPVLIDFTASWCPPCQVMKHEVWPDQKVGQLAAGSYIPLLMDVDQPGSREAANRYGISAIPTIVIVSADGTELRRGNFMSRDQMVKFLTRS